MDGTLNAGKELDHLVSISPPVCQPQAALSAMLALQDGIRENANYG